MIRFIKILKWLWREAPMVYYSGYHCGCCGQWWERPFVLPEFKSVDDWWDTWGVCPKGKGCWDWKKKGGIG